MMSASVLGNRCVVWRQGEQQRQGGRAANSCNGAGAQAVRDTAGVELKSDLHSSCLQLRRLATWGGVSRARYSVTVMQSRKDLLGKDVVVVGLGASGRAAVKLALVRGANVVAVDMNPNTPPLEVDPCHAGRLRFELGPHKRGTFHEASQLVLSPGVSPVQPDVASAIEAGIPALSELSFAAEALPKSIQVAAVSGTNGKSTVTTFAGQILRHAGVRTFVGGNLGTPLSEAAFQCLSFPADDPPYHAAVVEVSSYQMELPGMFHPKVGVILNLTPDHLERHKSMEIYATMKCRLFAQMTAENLAVIPQSDAFLRKFAAQSGNKGTRAWLGGLPGVQLDSQARRAFIHVPLTGVQAGIYLSSLKAVGTHNAHNAATAALIALALVDFGLNEDSIHAALPALQPPPHRMEIVHQDEKEVVWINDSKATNIDATYVGVKGIVGRQAVVLLGGQAKVHSPDPNNSQIMIEAQGLSKIVEPKLSTFSNILFNG